MGRGGETEGIEVGSLTGGGRNASGAGHSTGSYEDGNAELPAPDLLRGGCQNDTATK